MSVWLLVLLALAPAWAEEATPPAVAPVVEAASEPHDAKTAPPPVPVRMPAPAARRLAHEARTAAPALAAPPHPDAARPSRTIVVDAPPVTNASSQFVFRDVTSRTAPAGVRLRTMDERRAAVEAYRRGLGKEGGE